MAQVKKKRLSAKKGIKKPSPRGTRATSKKKKVIKYKTKGKPLVDVKRVRKTRKKYKRGESKPLEHYQKLHKLLSEIHHFSFRTTKRFTPQQKSAITRTYNNYIGLFKAIEKAAYRQRPYYFVKADRRTINALKPYFKHTNKGLLFPGTYDQILIPKAKKRKDMVRRYKNLLPVRTPEDLERYKQLAQNFGDLTDRPLVFTSYKSQHSIFVPLKHGEEITDLIDYVWDSLNPNYVNIAVAGHRARQTFDRSHWEDYAETIQYLVDKKYEQERVFNGVWAVWYI